MFLYQGWYMHKEKETSFLTFCMAILVLRRFLSASTSRFHKEIYLFS